MRQSHAGRKLSLFSPRFEPLFEAEKRKRLSEQAMGKCHLASQKRKNTLMKQTCDAADPICSLAPHLFIIKKDRDGIEKMMNTESDCDRIYPRRSKQENKSFQGKNDFWFLEDFARNTGYLLSLVEEKLI